MIIKCALDDDGCIDLLAVMRIMNQIDQEQAWALAYELAALMQRLWPASNNCATIESLAQIYINKEGWIHEKSLQLPQLNQQQQQQEDNLPQPCGDSSASSGKYAKGQMPPTPPITPELNEQLQRRRRARNEQDLVSSLGIALFWALDYGIAEDEERKLSRTMEYLIFRSQSSDLELKELERICIKRVPGAKNNKSLADQHYRTICRRLISDTIELSVLLDKIYTATLVMNGGALALTNKPDSISTTITTTNTSAATGTTTCQLNNQSSDIISRHHHHLPPTDYYLDHHMLQIDQDELSELGLPLASLRALKINDWARLWMQVIRELRQRRKFTQQQQQHNTLYKTTSELQAV